MAKDAKIAFTGAAILQLVKNAIAVAPIAPNAIPTNHPPRDRRVASSRN
jgi:hypothetical protein